MTSPKCDVKLAFTNDLHNNSPADLIHPGAHYSDYLVVV